MVSLKKGWAWLVKSSVDPRKTSLTVKMFLLGLIPAIMQVVLFACTFGVLCLTTNADELTSVVTVIADVVFWVLSIWAGVGFIIGFFRKVKTTTAGTNAVLNQ